MLFLGHMLEIVLWPQRRADFSLRSGPQKIGFAEHALAGVPTPNVRNRALASAACKVCSACFVKDESSF